MTKLSPVLKQESLVQSQRWEVRGAEAQVGRTVITAPSPLSLQV